MSERMTRFLTSIKIDNIDDFDLEFDLLSKDRFNPKKINMMIVKSTPWDYALLSQFNEALLNITYPYSIVFSYSSRPTPNDVLTLLEDWFQVSYHYPVDFILFAEEAREGQLVITYNDEAQKEKYKDVISEFKALLTSINYEFVISEKVSSEIKQEEVDKKTLRKIDKEASKIAKENIVEMQEEDDIIDQNEILQKREEERKQITQEVEDVLMQQMLSNKAEMDRERERARRNKRGNYTPIDFIDSIDANSGNVDFSGSIFKIDLKEYGDGGFRLLIGVADEAGGAITVNVRKNLKITKEFALSLTNGMNVRVRGVSYLDDYSKELTIQCHFLDLLPPTEIKVDDAPIKRVELHLHTNMSTQDGITGIKNYVDYAKALGHTALAITDHGVVQSFPDGQNAAKGTNIKMLYGCEFYMVEDTLSIIKNPSNMELNKANYVCFDFETTGLSQRYDTIIEFGAVRVEKGSVVKTIDLLINPNRPLSKRIIDITNITDDMLVGQPTIQEALPTILDFIKDAILVSHNADFDYGFLQEALRQCNMSPISNPVIDTLNLSRIYFPAIRSHTLGSICKQLEVKYDEESAHRADYDAKVLNDVWESLLEKLTKDNQKMHHQELSEIKCNPEVLQHLRPSHAIGLITCKPGIRDMYELVSLAHIKYFAGGNPRIPRSELSRLRSNLLLGSACFNGEIFDKARTKTKEDLKEAMKFYDYIEVQPPENYSFLVNMGELTNEEVIQYIKDIIEAADELGLPVVATGDVHYLQKKDKIFRDVYISSQVVGGGYHPLNPYSRRSGKIPPFDNPDQHYRSTQEMLDCFNFLPEEKAYEIVVTNTNMIANKIDSIMPAPNDYLYKPYKENCEQDLRDLCFNTAYEKYGKPLPEFIEKRLETELSKIIDNGYSITYRIAHDLVKKANEDGYIIGSRGSVGSSFAATMAGITEVNALPPHYICPKCKKLIWGKDIHPEIKSGFDLPNMACPDCGTEMVHDGQNIPFETFLGFHGEKVPDIDLNFPSDYQATGHRYTKVLLGEHNVFRAGTIGTIKDKTAYGFVKGYVERQYMMEGMSEEEAKVEANKFPKAKLDYLASGCIDVKRSTGQHPGGIVVVPDDHEIYEFTPIQYPADDNTNEWTTTHFDFEKIHDTLLKLDMLGHDDPVSLKMMCELTGVPLHSIPLNDPKVLSLFSSPEALNMEHDYLASKTGALALPEFGTETTRRILETANPKSFNDIVIISGISHGKGIWGGNEEKLIQSGQCTLQNVIGCRDDIMTYLLSMDIEPAVAFTIMEKVRKGKGLTEEYEAVMKAHNVPQYYIDSCKLIQYMFPKGHAIAYCMMAVRVGYFKVYYPLEFYATYFSIRSDKFDIESMIKGEDAIIRHYDELKLKNRSSRDDFSNKDKDIYETLKVAIEMVQRGFKFANIDLYKSDATKFVVDHENKALIPPFTTIDGLGASNAITVLEARKERPFSSKEDLLKRTHLSQTNVGVLDKMGVLKDLPDSDQISLFDF